MEDTKEIAAKVKTEKAAKIPKGEQQEMAPLTKSERIKKKAQAEIDKWNQEAIERTPELEEVEAQE